MDNEFGRSFSAVCISFSQAVEADVSKYINPSTTRVLKYIIHNENCTCSELAKQFSMSKSNATKITNYFYSKELIERHNDEKDRRIIRISCTEKGLETMNVVDSVMDKYISVLGNGFTDREKMMFSEKIPGIIGEIKKISEYAIDPFHNYVNAETDNVENDSKI